MPVIKFEKGEAKIAGGIWTSDDLVLTKLLNKWTENSIGLAALGEPFSSLYSPSNPWPDMTIAQEAVKVWNGEIIDEGEAPEHEPDRIY